MFCVAQANKVHSIQHVNGCACSKGASRLAAFPQRKFASRWSNTYNMYFIQIKRKEKARFRPVV